jgi:hypothetical protein
MSFCRLFLHESVPCYRAFAHHQATLLGSAEGGKGPACRGGWHVISINGQVNGLSLVIAMVW